ncbi:helix-turn-helix transcriptional regulator [Corynebacterium hindlerae]|uniref:helix-turn-helix transcriptional regulator n=1 Tax=Corynebacterium hindlerae TaxID=699041 RepID=UPI003AB02941
MAVNNVTVIDDDARPLAVKTDKAAEIIGISPGTLNNWRSRGDGPAYIKVGNRTVLYLISDLEAWLNAQQKVGA